MTPRAKDGGARERTRKRLGYAIRRREALVEVLAPDLRCAECGTRCFHASQLYIDHVDGRTWEASSLSPQMRAARMWREYNAGIPLRALCTSCSGRDGRKWMGRPRWRQPQRRAA
jgi:hypothetical protein